jgi:hypothetical protein
MVSPHKRHSTKCMMPRLVAVYTIPLGGRGCLDGLIADSPRADTVPAEEISGDDGDDGDEFSRH